MFPGIKAFCPSLTGANKPAAPLSNRLQLRRYRKGEKDSRIPTSLGLLDPCGATVTLAGTRLCLAALPASLTRRRRGVRHLRMADLCGYDRGGRADHPVKHLHRHCVRSRRTAVLVFRHIIPSHAVCFVPSLGYPRPPLCSSALRNQSRFLFLNGALRPHRVPALPSSADGGCASPLGGAISPC